MKHPEQLTTVSSSKIKYFVILILCTVICLIIIIGIFILINIKYSQISSSTQSLKIQSTISTTISTTTTTTLSPEEIHRLSLFKEFLNLSSTLTHPKPNLSPSMNKFMRLIYQQTSDQTDFRRKKRQISNLYLSDDTDFIISLPNQYKNNHHDLLNTIGYHFEYDKSLEYVIHIELVLPINKIYNFSISSSIFNISYKEFIQKDQNWLKINLTKYIKSFPLTFYLKFNHRKQKQLSSLFSSGFLTLYFRRSSSSSHSIIRRDLSSFYDNQLITYPDDPSYCQVHPLRTSFTDLNWSSWIIEPSSYEMNICSGTCHTSSNMGTYFIIQNLLNQKYPKKIPAPCCKPKRFSSTILLYYDGPNLILKRHENMRVVECGCSS